MLKHFYLILAIKISLLNERISDLNKTVNYPNSFQLFTEISLLNILNEMQQPELILLESLIFKFLLLIKNSMNEFEFKPIFSKSFRF